MKFISVLASSSLLLCSASLFAQTNDPDIRSNPYSVKRCSFAAKAVAQFAMTYPDDQEMRKYAIDNIANTPIQDGHEAFPTQSEFRTARIVMEDLVEKWTGDQPNLKDNIIADAAATCMLKAFIDSNSNS